MSEHTVENDLPEIERLRAEVKHWKDHAEEAGAGFSQVCRDMARVTARNRLLVEGVEALVDEYEVLAPLARTPTDAELFKRVADSLRRVIPPA